MTTELIKLLCAEPVKVTGKRMATPNRMVMVSEESTIADVHGREQERYRFELRLGAAFVNYAGNNWEESRRRQHELLIRTVTEHVYGDVRAKLREMYPIVGDMVDPEAREELFERISELIEMTQP